MPVVQLGPGELFANQFRVIRPLSEGGMGAVYVVEQMGTGAERALKLMLPQLVTDAKLRQRFEQEARIGARIESDHVVQVVAAGIDEPTSTPWLAMEFLKGKDLAEHIHALGPIAPAVTLLLFEQLCHALAAAHALGIVHRDLKPENIFLAHARRAGAPFTVKVLDFGIAKIAAEAKTTDTAAIGTPLWMAPEQSSQGSAIGPPTDVWALGLIAFRMLTGRYYWRAANAESTTMQMLLREILIDETPPASNRAAELASAQLLPQAFDAWFARCLNRAPAARFRDAGEAFAALSHALSTPVAAPRAPPLANAMAARPAPLPAHGTVVLGPTLAATPALAARVPAQIAQSAPAAFAASGSRAERSSSTGSRRAPVLIAAAAAVVLASGIGVTYFVVVAAKKSPVTATLPPASPDPKPPSLRASAVSAPSASASAPSIEASGAAMPPDVPNAKYYVALVARNGTSRPQADIERVLLGAFRDAFIASGVVQLAVPGLSDDAERALIKSCGLRAFTVLVFAEPFVSSSGGLTFKLKSTVIAEPDHALKGELSKSATMADAKPGDVANEDALFTTTAASVAEALLKTFFPPPPPAAPARAAPKKCTCAPGDPLCSCL